MYLADFWLTQTSGDLMNKIMILLLIGCGALASSVAVNAALITSGFTYSVSDGFSGPSLQGTHFHSNTGGAFGNPAGKAEVGGFFGSEEVRGLSEYNLVGLSAGGPAFVTFNVYLADGLFGQGGGAFDIDVYAYQGNNTENVSDWQATAVALIGSFNTGGLAVSDVLSFDVSTALDAALSGGDASFGIRLQQHTRDTAGPAYTFDTFRLTTTNDSNGVIPEPSMLGLVALGIAVLSGARFRKMPKNT